MVKVRTKLIAKGSKRKIEVLGKLNVHKHLWILIKPNQSFQITFDHIKELKKMKQHNRYKI